MQIIYFLCRNHWNEKSRKIVHSSAHCLISSGSDTFRHLFFLFLSFFGFWKKKSHTHFLWVGYIGSLVWIEWEKQIDQSERAKAQHIVDIMMRVKKGYSRLSKKIFFTFLENWEIRKKKFPKRKKSKIRELQYFKYFKWNKNVPCSKLDLEKKAR